MFTTYSLNIINIELFGGRKRTLSINMSFNEHMEEVSIPEIELGTRKLRGEIPTESDSDSDANSPLVEHRDLRELSKEELLVEIELLKQQMGNADNTGVHNDFTAAMIDRGGWLVLLLLVQSLSSLVIAHNQNLIKHHPTVVYFLTMLVGAGGNAGNQSAVNVVRSIAVCKAAGKKRPTKTLIHNELVLAVGLTLLLGAFGLIRAWLSPYTNTAETIAITISLCLIVYTSILIGTVLPFLLELGGLDPAHSSTTIQVVMDIMGVTLTCLISDFFLDSTLGDTVLAWFGITDTASSIAEV